MSEIALIGAIGGQTIAFRASAIEAVVEIDAVIPIPYAPEHVAGLAAIRSQVVTVVDCGLASGGPPCGPSGRSVLSTIDGHRYALRIDAIDDVCAHVILPGLADLQLMRPWSSFVTGRIDLGDGFALVIDPGLLVAVEAAAIAA